MPGFNILPLGGGFSAEGPSNLVEPRRKHRWAFESLGRGPGTFSQAELLVLQKASRPAFKFEPAEMHHNQEVAKFAGKQSWDPISLGWYDIEQDPDVSRGIYHWIETVVNMKSIAVAHPRFYKRTATLSLLDGTGQASESWTMYGTWPLESNWQELDYTSNEILMLEVSMSYDRATRTRSDGSCPQVPQPRPVSPNCPV